MSLISGLCRHFRTSLVTSPVTSSSTRSLTTTPSLGMAAMMKKRKRVDPMQQRQRDERKRKKLQKAVKKLSKKPRIVKPVWEMELPPDVAQNPQDHNRYLSHVLLQEVEARQPSTVLFAPSTSLPRVVCVMNQIHWG